MFGHWYTTFDRNPFYTTVPFQSKLLMMCSNIRARLYVLLCASRCTAHKFDKHRSIDKPSRLRSSRCIISHQSLNTPSVPFTCSISSFMLNQFTCSHCAIVLDLDTRFISGYRRSLVSKCLMQQTYRLV